MANIHLKVGGAASSPFATWANGATTLAGSLAAAVAGDDILCGTAYAETVASYELTIPGAVSNPSRLLCGTEGGTSGLTAMGTGAVLEATGTTFNIRGHILADGITWRGSSASNTTLNLGATSGDVQMHRNCRIELTGGHIGSTMLFGSITGGGSSRVALVDCTLKFGNPSQRINISYDVGGFGGSLDSTLAAVTGLFNLSSGQRGARLKWDGFNATNMATAGNIVSTITGGGVTAEFRRWSMPAGWTGAPVVSGQLRPGSRISLMDYSVGTTLFRAWVMDHAGTLKDEATVKVTAQAHSYKLTSTANCFPSNPMRGIEHFVPLSGAAQTVSLDICTDGVTLTDRECWIEIDYLASATSALSTRANDSAGPITAGTAQTTSTTPWTTTGLASPVRQTISASVTAGAASAAIVRLVLAKPSTTVYVAALATVA